MAHLYRGLNLNKANVSTRKDKNGIGFLTCSNSIYLNAVLRGKFSEKIGTVQGSGRRGGGGGKDILDLNFSINYISSVISGKYCNFIGLQECDLSILKLYIFCNQHLGYKM